MAITIIRRGAEKPAEPKPAFTIKRRDDGLERMRFRGELLDRAIQFPEDVGVMRSLLRARGMAVGDKDCQALWVRLSLDHFPFPTDPGDYAWLSVGIIYDLIVKHADEYLVPCDARDAVR